MTRYECQACNRPATARDFASRVCAHCSADALYEVGDAAAAGQRPRLARARLGDARRTVRVPCAAPLVAGIGLRLPALLFVTGPPGAGKSTEVARLCYALRRPPVVLDREMSEDVCDEVYERAGCPRAWRRRVERVDAADGWREAHEGTDDADTRVWDSLGPWAPEAERVAMMAALRERVRSATRPLLEVVIVQWSQQGRAAGDARLVHEACVEIEVHPRVFRVPQKCRWAPTPAEWPRASSG